MASRWRYARNRFSQAAHIHRSRTGHGLSGPAGWCRTGRVEVASAAGAMGSGLHLGLRDCGVPVRHRRRYRLFGPVPRRRAVGASTILAPGAIRRCVGSGSCGCGVPYRHGSAWGPDPQLTIAEARDGSCRADRGRSDGRGGLEGTCEFRTHRDTDQHSQAHISARSGDLRAW